jgi:hypothetical protein
VQTSYFLERLMSERVNEYRQLADETRRVALAEQGKRKDRRASFSWFSFLFRLLSRRLLPDLRPSALSVRAGDPRHR